MFLLQQIKAVLMRKITCPPYPSPKSSPKNDTRGVQGGSACVKEAYGYFFSLVITILVFRSLGCIVHSAVKKGRLEVEYSQRAVSTLSEGMFEFYVSSHAIEYRESFSADIADERLLS